LIPKAIFGAVAVVLQFFVPFSTSLAAGKLINIKICNGYAQPIYFAIAYQQSTGDWLSRGWLKAPSGNCYFFDTALSLPEFYYRAQTNRYRENGRLAQDTWGNTGTRSFCVDKKLQDTFNIWLADQASNYCDYVPFVSFREGTNFGLSSDVDVSYTLTFQPDGSVSTDFASAPAAK
jgi:uncharacterized membrane protein